MATNQIKASNNRNGVGHVYQYKIILPNLEILPYTFCQQIRTNCPKSSTWSCEVELHKIEYRPGVLLVKHKILRIGNQGFEISAVLGIGFEDVYGQQISSSDPQYPGQELVLVPPPNSGMDLYYLFYTPIREFFWNLRLTIMDDCPS
ncbi:hypothetical protein CDAR_25081 [Caerostris darwini]|uniref:Arrestin-like N-terminal domain-containing protein n=1 Tax=Caerostris darwini TaxID=1538125 RepID=A0AAV4MKS1_9ARAC|nr:hypothetical protein CDAR_25081 [Caerostris darwini]